MDFSRMTAKFWTLHEIGFEIEFHSPLVHYVRTGLSAFNSTFDNYPVS